MAEMLKGSSDFNPQKFVFLDDTWPHASSTVPGGWGKPKGVHFDFILRSLTPFWLYSSPKEGPDLPWPVPSRLGLASSDTAHPKTLPKKE